ncbi:MAG: hypothetical protein GF370_03200 [Candidatus Nealsonbacteria bacterium]|nr:hypothetical protein [Candidatus Nealsonbacteria bacterium]
MEEKNTLKIVEPNPKPVRLFFFWMGIIATVAYRIIIVLDLYKPSWVRASWYVGTIGFILYFGHRFSVAEKRAKLVSDNHLVEAIEQAECIDKKKKTALHYLVETSLTSKSRWNSAMIYILSLAALLIGIILDFSGMK